MNVLAQLTGKRALLAAIGLGALSAFALPPIYLLPVLFIAIPGLVTLIGSGTPRDAFWRGFWFAWGHQVLGLYWITEAIMFEAARFWWLVPIAVPGLALVLALFIAIPCWFAAKIRPGLPRVLVFAAGWSLMGIAQQFVATGFPWNPLGSVWEFPGVVGEVAIQSASLISVHGLTLLTVLLAATPAIGRRALGVGLSVVLLMLAWGAARIAEPALPAPNLTVVLVQGNIAQGLKRSREAYIANFERHLKLTEAGVAQAAGQPTVVVWPETASPFLMVQDENARAAVAEAAAGPAFIGSLRFDEHDRPRNSMIGVYGPGPVAGIFDKHHLVPFGEYVPDWLPLPIQVIPGAGFAKGSGPKTLNLPGVPPAGALICYEAIFPGQVIDASDRPAWMVNITNDSWFGNSTGPRQHLAAVRMRAVEEGLPIMRAANTGITAGFDAYGRELGRLEMNEEGVLLVKLPGALPPTLFARFGLVVPVVLASLCLLAGLWLNRRSHSLTNY